MKILLALSVILAATFAFAGEDNAQQKQSAAEKAFKTMSTTEAVASNAIYKQYPSLHFPEAKTRSLMHDDCISGDTYVGGAYRKCIAWSDKVNDCLETAVAPMTMPAANAPSSMKVRFYRKVSGLGNYEQTSSRYYLGARTVAIPSCK